MKTDDINVKKKFKYVKIVTNVRLGGNCEFHVWLKVMYYCDVEIN